MDESDLKAEIEKLSGQITALAQSITAQIKSMTETIYNNNLTLLRQVTSLEAWKEAHEKADGQQHEYMTGEIEELARHQGVTEAKVEVLEKAHEQAKGAAWMWRVIVGGAVAALGALEAWIHGGHKP